MNTKLLAAALLASLAFLALWLSHRDGGRVSHASPRVAAPRPHLSISPCPAPPAAQPDAPRAEGPPKLSEQAEAERMILKLKELMGGAELSDPDLQGPYGKEGAHYEECSLGPGTRQSQWIDVLCGLQTLCVKEKIRRPVLAGLRGLMEAYPPETTPEGRVILLLMGSLEAASLTNDEFVSRFGANEAALPVLLAGAACSTRLGKPLNENEQFWMDAFKEWGLGCRPLFRASKLYDGKSGFGRPRSWAYNGVDPLPGKLRDLALRSWREGTLHPSWGMGFCQMVGAKTFGRLYCPPDVAKVAGKVLAQTERTREERRIAIEALTASIADSEGNPESLQALKAALEVERDPDMCRSIFNALQYNRRFQE